MAGTQQTYHEPIKFAALARYYVDWVFRPAVLKLPGVSDPRYAKYRDNGAGSTGVYGWHFAAGEIGTHACEQLPHGYLQGSDLADPHVHFLLVNAPVIGETVTWDAEVEVTPLQGSCPLTIIFSGTYTFTGADAQWDDIYLPLDAGADTVYPGVGLTISSTGSVTITRGGTHGSEVVYKGFDFHVICDALGSDTPRNKTF